MADFVLVGARAGAVGAEGGVGLVEGGVGGGVVQRLRPGGEEGTPVLDGVGAGLVGAEEDAGDAPFDEGEVADDPEGVIALGAAVAEDRAGEGVVAHVGGDGGEALVGHRQEGADGVDGLHREDSLTRRSASSRMRRRPWFQPSWTPSRSAAGMRPTARWVMRRRVPAPSGMRRYWTWLMAG